MKKKYNIKILFQTLGIILMISCASEAPNVDPNFITQSATSSDTGSIYPQIVAVYPGGLQTSTTPTAIITNINPDQPGIVVAFSNDMENSGNEMDTNIILLEGVTPVAKTVTPTNTDSRVFTITPSATLTENTNFTIRINNTAEVSGDPSKTLIFDNLLNFNGTTFADYEFQTTVSISSTADTTSPTFASTNPADTATNVPVDLSGTSGYIQIVFNDNITPMIDPSTVNNNTVKLYDPVEVTGNLELDSTDADLKTYRFYPHGNLKFSTPYTLTISVSNSIMDFSSQALTEVSITFTTISEAAPVIDDYSVTTATSSTATITWSADRMSIKHLDIEAGAAPAFPNYVSPPDVHDTTKAFSFTHNATSLLPNTLYSFTISLDVDDTTTSAGPFDNSITYNAAFRTLPNTTEGATGNFKLAEVATTKSNIRIEQINQDTSYIFWADTGTGIRGQYFDTSAGGQATWDQWTDNTGDQIFTATGNVETINDGNNNVIVIRENGGTVYGASIVDSTGLTFNWGGPAGAGTTIYNGGTASNVHMALTDSGQVVTEISDGTHTAEMDYIYDTAPAVNFGGSVNVGDHVVNTAAATPASYYADVTAVVDNNFLELDSVVISSTELNYRIGAAAASTGNTVYVSSTVDDSTSGLIDFTDGTFTLQVTSTVDTTGLIGMTALAAAIQAATPGNVTCSAIGGGTTAAYLVITDTSGADILIASTGAVLAEFGFTAGTWPATGMSGVAGNDFDSYTDFSSGELISNLAGTGWASITGKAGANSPWTYTASNTNFLADTLDFNYYAYLNNGTAETAVLYDNGIDFSTLGGGVAANDIIINRATGQTAKITSIYGSSNEVLTLPGSLFETDGENYQILGLTDHNEFVTGGLNDSYVTGPPHTITRAGRDFTADGVISGNIIYNMDTDSYAEVVSAGTTTISLSTQIFSGNNQCFIIYGVKGMVVAWDESNDILGKTVSTSNGTGIYPDATTGTRFTVSSFGENEQKPYSISDQNKNAIVIYESEDTVDSVWDIRAKKISATGAFQWADPADDASDAGIAIATSTRDDLIQDVISDNNGGAWILYTSHDASPGTYRIIVAHINTSGTVSTVETISGADNPVMARISVTQIAIAYELYTTIGLQVGKRINMKRYDNSPALVGASLHVRSAQEAISQLSPRIEQDGVGGFYISWLEMKYYPSIYYSIFAQRFDSGATRQLGDDAFVGIPVLDSQATTNVYTIEHDILYKSGPNGVFFWQDERSAGVDIYFEDL